MKSININQLIRKKRVTPVTIIDKCGNKWVVAFERKPGSPKAGQRYDLKQHIAVGDHTKPETNLSDGDVIPTSPTKPE